MRKEVIPFNEFVSGEWRAKENLRQAKFQRIETRVRIGLTVFSIVAVPVTAFAAGDLDRAGRTLYNRLLLFGKWVIIIKGGVDLVNSVINGDFQRAKTQFISYLLVFCALHGLPWALDEIDALFKEM